VRTQKGSLVVKHVQLSWWSGVSAIRLLLSCGMGLESIDCTIQKTHCQGDGKYDDWPVAYVYGGGLLGGV